jgi:hypothetical protein
MTFPGLDLMSMATQLIDAQWVTYYKALSRTTNSLGIDVAQYADGQPLQGVVQAVPLNLYTVNGLDFQKNYINVFFDEVSADFISSGQLVFDTGDTFDGGKTFDGQLAAIGTASWTQRGTLVRGIKHIERDTSGDQIAWDGFRWQLLSKTDWRAQDGWIQVLCVRIGPNA